MSKSFVPFHLVSSWFCFHHHSLNCRMGSEGTRHSKCWRCECGVQEQTPKKKKQTGGAQDAGCHPNHTRLVSLAMHVSRSNLPAWIAPEDAICRFPGSFLAACDCQMLASPSKRIQHDIRVFCSLWNCFCRWLLLDLTGFAGPWFRTGGPGGFCGPCAVCDKASELFNPWSSKNMEEAPASCTISHHFVPALRRMETRYLAL